MRYLQCKIQLLIFALILYGQVFGQNLTDISFGNDSTFDIITWNIEWFTKNGVTTVDSDNKIIESLSADLIELQEIEDSSVLCRQMIDNTAGYELFMDDDWFRGLTYIYKTS